ncbi:MAG TPA: hypothetical protein VGN07_14925 [Steroidobacteraceae bacterium]|jgi:hypothetical protein
MQAQRPASFKYESRHTAPLSREFFLRRMLDHFVAAMLLASVSLAIGMMGYAYFEQLAWRDAFLNSAMLLGGMGPVDPPHTPGGKVFAGMYALYAGLVFIITAGVVVTPVLHRLLHKFHWKD